MNNVRFFTIGVYGTTMDSFVGALKIHRITHFCDIRQRRGLRGKQYAYANARELQRILITEGIEYLHEKRLAPNSEVRETQKLADKVGGEIKSSRSTLASSFVKSYTESCLKSFNTTSFANSFPDGAQVVLFCVERSVLACHRGLVAAHLEKTFDRKVEDITP